MLCSNDQEAASSESFVGKPIPWPVGLLSKDTYIDAFWLVAWVLTAALVLLLFLKPPPPNPLTPPRIKPPR
jgi:hypothetical protein